MADSENHEWGVCPQCGNSVLHGARFCHNCGYGTPTKQNRTRTAILASAAVLVLGAGAFAGFKLLGPDDAPAARQPAPTLTPVAATTPSTPSPTPSPTTEVPGDFAELYAKVRSGVIRIEASTCEGGSVGTGFLVEDDLIATAAHVVDGAASLGLSFGKESNPTIASGVVVGFDKSTDLALIRADRSLDGHVFDLADSTPEVGEEVVAIGFPKGDPMTLTRGIVSGLDREITMDIGTFRGLIQTDAAINPGNSGGPVLDLTGTVQGVADAVRRDTQGIAYAVPADTVQHHIKKWGSSTKSMVNVKCDEPIPPDTTVIGLTPPGDDQLSLSVTEFFTAYFNAINQGDFESVWGLMGPKLRPASPEKLADSLSTTMDFDISVLEVKPSGKNGAMAHVVFISTQAPEKGPDGNTCTMWNLDYTLEPVGGGWQIAKAAGHGGAGPWSPC